jgi:arylsulfatase
MPSDRPNILFLFPDQLRADFVGAYGATCVDTPNMDRLAAEGVRYDDAMSASPLCVPARTALMTGMHALRNGTLSTFHGLRGDYRAAGLATLPELLNDAGYTTSAIGKMHFYPWDARLGFQRRVIAEDKRWVDIADDYHHFLAARGLRRLRGDEHEGYAESKGAVVSPLPLECSPDHFVGAEAVTVIEQAAGSDEPFAMMVGFPGPHCPYDPVEASLGRVRGELIPDPVGDGAATPSLREGNVRSNRGAWNGVDYADSDVAALRKVRHHYAALVAQIDDVIGTILDALERTGQLDDTLVVLSSDHGDYLGDHGMVGKQGFHEPTVRVPLIVRPPASGVGRAGRGSVDTAIVELRDVTATILAYAGVERPGWMDAEPLPGLGHGAPRTERSAASVCIGLNYADHAAESGMALPDEPVVFFKAPTPSSAPTTTCCCRSAARRPTGRWSSASSSARARYLEDEAAARRGHRRATACPTTSPSARSSSSAAASGSRASPARRSTRSVPWLVTPTRSATSGARMWLEVNGERVQDGTTANMVFGSTTSSGTSASSWSSSPATSSTPAPRPASGSASIRPLPAGGRRDGARGRSRGSAPSARSAVGPSDPLRHAASAAWWSATTSSRPRSASTSCGRAAPRWTPRSR